MLEFEKKSEPFTVSDLITVTRENGRNLIHYQDILSQRNLEQIYSIPNGSILEIGTGLGNAIPGLFKLTNEEGKIISFDAVNKIYSAYFPNNPPARVCVEVSKMAKNALV